MTPVPLAPPRRLVDVTVDGESVRLPEGSTVLDACPGTPTLCYGDTLTPKNACRICVVEVTGARTLVPACSRRVEPGMERVEHRMLVSALLRTLPQRERAIVVLRFRDGLTQSQIAARLEMSQMHVSRLLARTLGRLRDQIEADDRV